MSEDASDADVEDNWREFWAPLLIRDGQIDVEQLKKEMFDFSTLMQSVRQIYDEITGGRISKPLTLPCHVVNETESHYRRVLHGEEHDACEDPRECHCACDACFKAENALYEVS